jgi:AcrR family transcriptional regulator
MEAVKLTQREAQRLRTRETVFQAALTEFKRAGVAGADVPAIAAAAGVAKGTFFFHFPTKEHVLDEIKARDEERIDTALRRFLATPHRLEDGLAEVIRLFVAAEKRMGPVLFKDILVRHFSAPRPSTETSGEHPLMMTLLAEFQRARDEGEILAGADIATAARFFLLSLYLLLISYPATLRDRREVFEKFLAKELRALAP